MGLNCALPVLDWSQRSCQVYVTEQRRIKADQLDIWNFRLKRFCKPLTTETSNFKAIVKYSEPFCRRNKPKVIGSKPKDYPIGSEII